MRTDRIDILRHGSHDTDKALTFRSEVFPDVAEGIHVTLFAHLFHYLKNGLHCLTLLEKVIDCAFLHVQLLFDEIMVGLQRREEFTKSRSRYFRSLAERIGSRAECQQFGRSDTRDAGETREAFCEVNDMCS